MTDTLRSRIRWTTECLEKLTAQGKVEGWLAGVL